MKSENEEKNTYSFSLGIILGYLSETPDSFMVVK